MAVPALFTRTSSPPNVSTVFSTGFARLGIRGVRLNGDRLSAVAFNLLNYGRGGISTFRVGDGYLRPVYGQTFGDGGADTARAAGDKRNFSLQSPIHGLSPVSFKVGFVLYRLV
jgi:hypothetical protein